MGAFLPCAWLLLVLGAATAPASVTVNGAAAAERGEYFHRAVPVANGSGPVWLGVTNTATLGGSSASATGYTLVAPTNQTFSYDAHGNLTNDSLWAYTWDADNRLIQAETLDTVPAAGRLKLEFTYDHQGRRVRKMVSNWVSGAWTLTSDQRFVYDGWNLLAILTPNSQLLSTFTWGLDLSGTVDGAGGIGGLLVVREHAGNGTNHFPCFDGNGNVTALVNANGIVTARYEHGPFGEPIQASGPLAKANPFRWSTKFCDEETGLVYYGKRYYSPSLGRWLSKDPIEEEGGLNLYGFVANGPVNAFDLLGEAPPKNANKWVAIAQLLLSLGRELQGESPTRTGSPIIQAQQVQRFVEKAKEQIIHVISGMGGDGDDPHGKFYQHKGGWGIKGRAFMAVLGTLGSATYIASGQAEADATRFVNNAVDFARHQKDGDSAWADLDSAMMAVDMLNITGSNYVAETMWGGLNE